MARRALVLPALPVFDSASSGNGATSSSAGDGNAGDFSRRAPDRGSSSMSIAELLEEVGNLSDFDDTERPEDDTETDFDDFCDDFHRQGGGGGERPTSLKPRVEEPHLSSCSSSCGVARDVEPRTMPHPPSLLESPRDLMSVMFNRYGIASPTTPRPRRPLLKLSDDAVASLASSFPVLA